MPRSLWARGTHPQAHGTGTLRYLHGCACSSRASATAPACPCLQDHIALIRPAVTTRCRRCPRPSRGLPAGQSSPPPTPPARPGFPCLCQERKEPSCSPRAEGMGGLEGAWPRDGSGTGALPWRQRGPMAPASRDLASRPAAATQLTRGPGQAILPLPSFRLPPYLSCLIR